MQQVNDAFDGWEKTAQRIDGDNDILSRRMKVADERFDGLAERITIALKGVTDQMATLESRVILELKGVEGQMATLETRVTDKMTALETRVTDKMNNMMWQIALMLGGLLVLMLLGGTDVVKHLMQQLLVWCLRVPSG